MRNLIYKDEVLDALQTCLDTEVIQYNKEKNYIRYEQAVYEINKLQDKSELFENFEQLASCADTISRQAAIDVLVRNSHVRFIEGKIYVPYEEVKENIQDLPSAQPERKKGKWLIANDIPSICSNCGANWIDDYVDSREFYLTGKVPNYCPNCGSDNRGEQDD